MAAVLLAAGAVPQAARAQPSPLERYEASAHVMGSTFTIAAYGEHRGRLASAVKAAFEEARRIDSFLSNYKEDSELSRINRQAARQAMPISAEMTELLAQCLEYSRLSEGGFDITVGPLMKVWGFYKGSGRLPSQSSITRARRRVGYQRLELDREKQTVRFRRRGMELDPGGIGKGYAVDRMVAVLKKARVQIAFLGAGESSMYALGAPPKDPQGWRVRIRHPKKTEQIAAEVCLKDQSLSTSGSYEKFFEADGKIYSHIMDPRTGMPAEEALTVSVIAPSTLDSEAWATAFYVNGPDWAKEHARNDFNVFLCVRDGSCHWLGASRP